MNKDGVRFVHKRTQPLAVPSMNYAEQAIAKELKKRGLMTDESDADRVNFARHLAWIIGFDTLTEDRAAIHELTSKIVEEVD